MEGTFENASGGICRISVNVNFNPRENVETTPAIPKNRRVTLGNEPDAKRPKQFDEFIASHYSEHPDGENQSPVFATISSESRARYKEHLSNPYYYQMNHFPKGRVLIINNYFKGMQLRKGSEKDVENLQILFQHIGTCSTTVMRNLSAKEICMAVNQFAKSSEQQGFCAIFIMSHGEADDNRDVLLGNDRTRVNAKELVDCFKSDRYPHLKHVPVLVFFQMCRGIKYGKDNPHLPVERHVADDVADNYKNDRWLLDALSKILPGGVFLGSKDYDDDVTDAGPDLEMSGLSRSSHGDEDHADERESEHIGNEPNMMVSFSTMEGYKSFRNEGSGSWFIQSICKIFRGLAQEEDVIALMNRVHVKLTDMTANCQGDMRGSRVCSRTIHTFGQTKLYLFPGLP